MITESQVIHYSKRFTPTVASVEKLGGFHNHVFLVNGRDGFVLRISSSKHRSVNDTICEIDFLLHLKRSGASVAYPLQGVDGEYVYEIKHNGCDCIISAFSVAKGADWLSRGADADDQYRMCQIGRAIGKIHNISKSYHPDNSILRRQWHQSQHLVQAKAVFENYNPDLASAFSVYLSAMNQLPRNIDSFGLIHGDFLFSNYHAVDGNIVVFDFDECEYSWYIYDVAVCMYYYLLGSDPSQLSSKAAEAEEMLYGLLSGYLLETELDRFWIENINLFFQMRDYVLLSTMLNQSTHTSEGWQKTFFQGALHRQLNNKPFIKGDFVTVYNRSTSTIQK